MANLPQRRTHYLFPELSRLQRDIDRMFENFLAPMSSEGEFFAGGQPSFFPTCEIAEKKDHYLMTFDLPGMKKEDIQIDFRNGQLSISGERKSEYEDKSEGRFRTERSYGSFYRSFTLPSGIKAEQIKADYKDGVLQLSFPKVESSQSSRIQIGEGGGTPKKAA